MQYEILKSLDFNLELANLIVKSYGNLLNFASSISLERINSKRHLIDF